MSTEPVFISFKDNKTLWVLNHKGAPGSGGNETVTILPTVTDQELRFSMVLYDNPIRLVKNDQDDLFASNRKTVPEVVRAVNEFRRRCGEDKNFLAERRFGGGGGGSMSGSSSSAAPAGNQQQQGALSNNNQYQPHQYGGGIQQSPQQQYGGVQQQPQHQQAYPHPQQQQQQQGYQAMSPPNGGGGAPMAAWGTMTPTPGTTSSIVGAPPSGQQWNPQQYLPMGGGAGPPNYNPYPSPFPHGGASGNAAMQQPPYGMMMGGYPGGITSHYGGGYPPAGTSTNYRGRGGRGGGDGSYSRGGRGEGGRGGGGVGGAEAERPPKGLNPLYTLPDDEVRRVPDPLEPSTVEVTDKVKELYLGEAAMKTDLINVQKNVFIAVLPESKATVWLRDHRVPGGSVSNRRYVVSQQGVIMLMSATYEECFEAKPVELFNTQLCSYFALNGFCARKACAHSHRTPEQVRIVVSQRHTRLAAMTRTERTDLEDRVMARERKTQTARMEVGLRPVLALDIPVGLIFDGAPDDAPSFTRRPPKNPRPLTTTTTSSSVAEGDAVVVPRKKGRGGSTDSDDTPRINEAKLLSLVSTKWEVHNEGKKFSELPEEERTTLLNAYRAKLVERKKQRRGETSTSSSSSESSDDDDADKKNKKKSKRGSGISPATPITTTVVAEEEPVKAQPDFKALLQALEVTMLLERDDLESKGKKGLKKLIKECVDGAAKLLKKGGKRPREDAEKE